MNPASQTQLQEDLVDEPPPDDVPNDVGYRSEAKKALKNWRKLVIDWRKEFPAAGLPLAPQPLDMVEDLMNLNMGS
eukprot:4646963-Prymnesium_polylepis.1